MAFGRIFQIRGRQNLRPEYKMQKVPHITNFLGLLLIVTLCISCSNEQSSSSYVREQVEYLKKQTTPSNVFVKETAGITTNRQSVSAQWEFDVSQTRAEYLGWVTQRLQPAYALKSLSESSLVFGRLLENDYESVKIEAVPTKESLHVKVVYVVFPD